MQQLTRFQKSTVSTRISSSFEDNPGHSVEQNEIPLLSELKRKKLQEKKNKLNGLIEMNKMIETQLEQLGQLQSELQSNLNDSDSSCVILDD